MAGFVPRQRAESALRFLPQKIATFEPFHIGNARLFLKDFVDHMERDDVLIHVTAAIRRHASITGKAWADASVAAGSPRLLPQDPLACLALRFDVLKQVKLDKIDIRYFAASFYPGEHLNEKLMHWKRAIVHPLASDLRLLAEALLARLPEDERFDAEALAGEVLEEIAPRAFGPRSWTEADDEKAEKTGKLDAALEALDRAVARASDLTADEKHDLALEVKILGVEARRGRKERVAPRLASLAARASLKSAAGEVEKCL